MRKVESFDFTLVMTASVNPNGMTGISRESIDNRERQYIDTLSFYASRPSIKQILFAENSNWDLSRIRASVAHPEKVSWLSLDENRFPREWGKGYGEFLLMDKVVRHLEARNGASAVLVKVTGRFPILNIEAMIREFAKRKPLNLAVDTVDHSLYRWLGLDWASHKTRTILYAVTVGFYQERIRGRYREIPGTFTGAESLMYDVLSKARNDFKGVYDRFKREPRLSGHAGISKESSCIITGANYDGLMARTKRFVSQMVRIFLPFLKI